MISKFQSTTGARGSDSTDSSEGVPVHGGDASDAWKGCIGEVEEHRVAPGVRKSVLRASVRGGAIRVEGGFDGQLELCDLGGRARGRILVRDGAGNLPLVPEGLYLVYPVNEPARGALVRVFR